MLDTDVREELYWSAKAQRDALRGAATPDWWEDVDPASAETLLHELPTERSVAWRVLDAWLDRWAVRPLAATDGASSEDLQRCEERLGRQLPDALREFHRLVGRRPDLLQGQDRWLELDRLEWHEEDEFSGVVLCWENQGVVGWGIQTQHIDLPDPPVTVFRDVSRVETARFTHFAIFRAAFEAIMGSPTPGAWGLFELDAKVGAEFQRMGYRSVDLGKLGYGVYDDIEVFEHRQAMAFVGNVAQSQLDVWLTWRDEALYDGLPNWIRSQLQRHG